MISVDAVGVEFSGTTLFSNITFNINEDDRIALMGKNGAGKSTLLKIMAGASKPTRGKVSAPKDAIIAYLPQHLLTDDDCSVFEETSKAFSKILNMKREIDDLNKQLETRVVYSGRQSPFSCSGFSKMLLTSLQKPNNRHLLKDVVAGKR